MIKGELGRAPRRELAAHRGDEPGLAHSSHSRKIAVAGATEHDSDRGAPRRRLQRALRRVQLCGPHALQEVTQLLATGGGLGQQPGPTGAELAQP